MEKQSKKRSAPPRYDDAFKAGAVSMVTEQGRSMRQVALELGICVDTLRSWLDRAGHLPASIQAAERSAGKQRALEAENRELRKQLAQKDEVIDVLKKSVGILSKP